MKKAIKIIAAILAVLIAAAAVMFVFFPGLPTYIKVKTEYENIDRTIEDFPVTGVPDSFKPFAVNGLSFFAPADAEQKEYGSTVKFGESGMILVTEGDVIEEQKMYSEELGWNTDQWEDSEYGEDEHRHFFDKIGAKYPDPEIASDDLLWFFKDGFTAKDCLKLRSADRDIFLELAEAKELSWGMEESFRFDGDGFTGYVSKFGREAATDQLWTVMLYPDGAGSKYYSAMLKGSDDTKSQIISSIKLEK